MAAFEGVAYEEENYEHYVEDYDVGELYYNMNFRLPDLPGVTQTADHQDVLSLTYVDYCGRDKEGNPPLGLNNKQLNMSPPPQFRNEEYEEKFE